MVTKHEKIFVQKLRQLLNTPTFDDIAFNCKDGKVSGNRLILSLYSSFLRKIFEDNLNIVSHPLNDDPSSGINITEVETKYLEKLLRILNTQTSADVHEDMVDGIVDAARLMEIELKVDQLRNGLIRIRAIPDFENNPKKKIHLGESVDIAASKKNGNEVISKNSKETKIKNSQNSGIKQQSKAKNKTKTPTSTSTVCPYCNITCKSVRGLQVHVGYIHKNEVKIVKNEPKEEDSVTDKSKPDTENPVENDKSDTLVTVTAVVSDDLPQRKEENLVSNSLCSSIVCEKPVLDAAHGSGDYMGAQSITPVMDGVYPNNRENFNQFPPQKIGNFLNNQYPTNEFKHPNYCDTLMAGPDFTLLPRQQGQGTLICLPKTQLYEQIENGYSCGICEMKFPNLANLNVHMTYCHGLTILVKEN